MNFYLGPRCNGRFPKVLLRYVPTKSLGLMQEMCGWTIVYFKRFSVDGRLLQGKYWTNPQSSKRYNSSNEILLSLTKSCQRTLKQVNRIKIKVKVRLYKGAFQILFCGILPQIGGGVPPFSVTKFSAKKCFWSKNTYLSTFESNSSPLKTPFLHFAWNNSVFVDFLEWGGRGYPRSRNSAK